MRKFFLSFCLPLVLLLSSAHAGERSDTARSISMTCGGTKVEIVCGYNEKPSEIDDRVCSHNTLTFTLPDGKVIAPSVPKSHDPGSSPESLYCAYGKRDNDTYVIVTYSSGSHDCAKCHLSEVFSKEGDFFKEGVPWQKTWIEKGLPISFESLSIEGKH